MGNEKSEAKKELQVQISHPRFSKSKIITLQNQKYLQTSQAIDQQEYKKWKTAVDAHKSPSNHLLLPTHTQFNRLGLCGHTGTVTINYQNYPYLLTEEIYNRNGKKSRFTEQDLWFLLFSLTRARQQAIEADHKLGDVRPNNIFLNEDGNIKVSNTLTWPLENTNIQKTMDKIETYISPEDLARIEQNQFFEGPSDLSEAFSFGLTLLSAGNLREYESLYDLKKLQFDLGQFNQALAQWQQNAYFSEVLRGTVSLLTHLQPSKRLSCLQLKELLQKHKQLITKKQNFVVDNAPQKLHDEIQRNRLAFAPPQHMVFPPAHVGLSSALKKFENVVLKNRVIGEEASSPHK